MASERPENLREPPSGRPQSYELTRPQQLTPPPTRNSEIDGLRSPMRTSIPPDPFAKICFISSTYEWNRKYFLQPDIGYDPIDDLLSPKGRERSARLMSVEE
jgi:hypothetical protein